MARGPRWKLRALASVSNRSGKLDGELWSVSSEQTEHLSFSLQDTFLGSLMLSRLPVCRRVRLVSEILCLISCGSAIIISIKRCHHLESKKKKNTTKLFSIMWSQSYSPKQKCPKSFQCDHLLSDMLYSLKLLVVCSLKSGSQVDFGNVHPPLIGKMPNKHSQNRTQRAFCQNIIAAFGAKPTTC